MSTSPAATLPELAAVPWRARVDALHLRRQGRLWTLSVLCHVVPLCGAAIGLALLNPVTTPVGLILLAHAWVIPELYANRGAKVLLPARGQAPRPPVETGASVDPEAVAVGLLGDLVGHGARQLQRRTGFMLERGRLGVWVLGQAGSVLVRPGGRRADCFCVRAADPALPAADRIAHLLLALREDELGFATVANHAFSGAAWRVRRRLPPAAREAFAAAVRAARAPA